MVTLASKLITRAYYGSGIRSRDFDTVSGADIEEGLDLLNEVLAATTPDKGMIPYYSFYEQAAQVDTEEYFIPNLIEAESLTYFLDSVRYVSRKQSRRQYFNTFRAEDVSSLPVTWHFERTLGGANLFLYFKPDKAYPLKITGIFRLSKIPSINTDLELTLDDFYIGYLKYTLIDILCTAFQVDVPPGAAKEHKRYVTKITSQSAKLDLTNNKLSTLNRGNSLNWGQVNIGRGWEP